MTKNIGKTDKVLRLTIAALCVISILALDPGCCGGGPHSNIVGVLLWTLCDPGDNNLQDIAITPA